MVSLLSIDTASNFGSICCSPGIDPNEVMYRGGGPLWSWKPQNGVWPCCCCSRCRCWLPLFGFMHKITAHKCNAAAAAAAAQVCSQPAMRPAKAANLMKIAAMATLLALLCSVILARIKSNFALLVFRVASKHTHTHHGTHSHTPWDTLAHTYSHLCTF